MVAPRVTQSRSQSPYDRCPRKREECGQRLGAERGFSRAGRSSVWPAKGRGRGRGRGLAPTRVAQAVPCMQVCVAGGGSPAPGSASREAGPLHAGLCRGRQLWLQPDGSQQGGHWRGTAERGQWQQRKGEWASWPLRRSDRRTRWWLDTRGPTPVDGGSVLIGRKDGGRVKGGHVWETVRP